MDIKTIAHYVLPASVRDVSSGIYHLAKRDATQEQCSKLAAGAIRISIATAATLACLTASLAFPPLWASVFSTVIPISLSLSDLETFTLAIGTLKVSGGLQETALGVAILARGSFGGLPFVLLGVFSTGIGWLFTREPRDSLLPAGLSAFRGLLSHKIDNLSEKLGHQMYLKTCLSSR